MKTYIKAAGGVLLAIVLAWCFMRTAHNALGMDEESNTLDDFSDMMLAARELFQVDFTEFQDLTAALQNETELYLIARRDGTPTAFLNGEMMTVAEAYTALGLENVENLTAITETLFTGADVEVEGDGEGEVLVSAHVRVQEVVITEQCVQFFTDYHAQGCVGLLYRKVQEQIPGYDFITLLESDGAWEPDWQIFYQMEE